MSANRGSAASLHSPFDRLVLLLVEAGLEAQKETPLMPVSDVLKKRTMRRVAKATERIRL